jgi:hypothetical protein
MWVAAYQNILLTIPAKHITILRWTLFSTPIKNNPQNYHQARYLHPLLHTFTSFAPFEAYFIRDLLKLINDPLKIDL